MKKRVVITGIGPAVSTGVGKETFFDNIINLKTNILEIPDKYENNYRFKSRYAVPDPEFNLEDYGISKSKANIMEKSAKMSVLCTKLALDDAKIKIGEADDAIIAIGLGMNSLQTAFESYQAHALDPEKKTRFNRMVIPMLMSNSVSAWISILFGIKGLNYTVNASCASGTIAIGEAYKNISGGRCNMAITGGVEVLGEKTGAIMRGFDMLSTLTKAEDGKPRPFSIERSGFLFNEGAGCILILESLKSALERKADIYAEIVGYESSSDSYNILQMEPSGENIEMLFEKIKKGRKVDYINAHGTGTLLNDDIEAKVIQKVFGNLDIQPYINSTKGILGHSIGASGALEAAVVAMSVNKSIIHGNLTEKVIDNLNIPVKSFEHNIHYAASASYGFGGHNAVLLFKRYDRSE